MITNNQPGISKIISDIVIWLIINDVLSYHIHKLLHTKYFYKFHKIHHEYYEPNIFCTEYTHFIEQIFLITSPPFIGLWKFYNRLIIHSFFIIAFILSMREINLLSLKFYFIFVITYTYFIHSGYNFMKIPSIHFIHHQK